MKMSLSKRPFLCFIVVRYKYDKMIGGTAVQKGLTELMFIIDRSGIIERLRSMTPKFKHIFYQ